MIEREVKLRLDDVEAFRRRLGELGWQSSGGRLHERNAVYDTADSTLGATHRLLRVRETGGEGILTVKLPSEHDGVHKVRREHEIRTADPVELHRILESLDYRPGWIYEKYRTEFRRDGSPGVVDLDETPIGDFVEFEGPADWIDAAVSELGFSEQDYLTGTYRDLFEAWVERTGSTDRDMVFAQDH